MSRIAHWLDRRRLRRVPLGAIADARDGAFVRLGGIVDGEPTLRAPLSGRPCCAYELIVERDAGIARYVALREVDAITFRIVDGDLRAVVEPHPGARIALRIMPLDLVGAAPPRVRAIVEAPRWLESTWRYSEGILALGDPVTVAGRAVREPDPDAAGGYRDAPTRVRLTGSPSSPLMIGDDADATR